MWTRREARHIHIYIYIPCPEHVIKTKFPAEMRGWYFHKFDIESVDSQREKERERDLVTRFGNFGYTLHIVPNAVSSLERKVWGICCVVAREDFSINILLNTSELSNALNENCFQLAGDARPWYFISRNYYSFSTIYMFTKLDYILASHRRSAKRACATETYYTFRQNAVNYKSTVKTRYVLGIYFLSIHLKEIYVHIVYIIYLCV